MNFKTEYIIIINSFIQTAAKNSSINLIPANRPDICVEIHQFQFIEANLIGRNGEFYCNNTEAANILYSLYTATL